MAHGRSVNTLLLLYVHIEVHDVRAGPICRYHAGDLVFVRSDGKLLCLFAYAARDTTHATNGRVGEKSLNSCRKFIISRCAKFTMIIDLRFS